MLGTARYCRTVAICKAVVLILVGQLRLTHFGVHVRILAGPEGLYLLHWESPMAGEAPVAWRAHPVGPSESYLIVSDPAGEALDWG
jgi:hypothetical protein